jgi:hypothetical protein
MKRAIWKWLAINSHIVLVISFWIYFIVYVITKTFLKLPVVFNYILCTIGGVLLGYKFALWSIRILKRMN